MRRMLGRTVVIAFVAAILSGCISAASVPSFTLARVDRDDAAERALVGGAAGAALGVAIGASFSINPAIGSVIGAETGGAFGAAIGAATAQPLPDYKPIAVPTAAVIPGFYDTWPPGYHPPPFASQTPPPPG
jgi:hypothetical protein